MLDVRFTGLSFELHTSLSWTSGHQYILIISTRLHNLRNSTQLQEDFSRKKKTSNIVTHNRKDLISQVAEQLAAAPNQECRYSWLGRHDKALLHQMHILGLSC